MSSGKGLSDFPDLEAKLQKPGKQSAFEKQRAEAEAKRQREAAETAAVYEDFVKSFDRDNDDDDSNTPQGHGSRGGGGVFGSNRGSRAGFGGPPGGGGPSRRHFVASGLKSGPGSLGPAPMSFGKKRSFQDFGKGGGQRDRSAMGFDDGREQQGTTSVTKAFETSDDEEMTEVHDRAEEKATARPTLRLLNLPPGTSPATIKAMMPANLAVEQVKLIPPAATGGSERKSMTAIVTLSQETPANDMDAAVSALQNRYMGYGFYLALHRHLSSAVSNSAALSNLTSSSNSAHPFGAKPVEQNPNAKDGPERQPGFQRGFAPPSSYGPNYTAVNRANILHVPVRPPQNIKTIQLINMVIEGILEHGPEFEALLMSRPEVQRDEKWAWIWDARSEGGVWLRWRLWEVVTGSQSKKDRGKYLALFEGAHAWKAPDKPLPFEYTTSLEEFVSDSEYNSSDDEDMDGEANREGQGAENDKAFLNPLEKAKLIHLLARLPPTLTRLRKGDIARVTAFAIMHASRGVDEVVDIIVSNVEKPFCLTAANPERKREAKEQKGQSTEEGAAAEASDSSAARLVALYVISDILSCSSTSGVRHAWRYRQLVEVALRERNVFETLGGLAERLGWGRLRAEKWKRSVGLVLNLWEGWCVFPAESQTLFVNGFENPPVAKPDEAAAGEGEEGVDKRRWKVVDKSANESPAIASLPIIDDDDVEGEPIEDDDVEGEPIDDDDIEGEPIDEDDVAGEPIDEADIDGEPMDEDEALGSSDGRDAPAAAPVPAPAGDDGQGSGGAAAGQSGGGLGHPRRRMRAVDMFADGEDSDGA